MRATYLIHGFSVAMLAVAASVSFAQDKPKPAAKAEPTDPKTLNLRLDGVRTWKPGEQPDSISISLANRTKQLREVPELLAYGNELTQCPAITYVVRFENGLTVEIENGGDTTWAPGNEIPWRPIALPTNGFIVDKSSIRFLLWTNNDFQKHASRGQPFTLTAICRKLKLKSNTMYINKYPVPEKGKEHDPFKDADDYHARRLFEARQPIAPPPRPKAIVP